jgi:putative membrane protein
MTRDIKLIALWLFIFSSVLIWSVIKPYDLMTWYLEVAPALIALIVMALTYKSFRLTQLVCWLILFHCIILMVGGHYTYAKVPLFNWLKDAFDLSRNHYDKVGHFVQGFVPAIIAREILLRRSPLQPGKWLIFMIICICLAISAFYELIEWWVALLSDEAADSFLGTQGYIWDTQSDMAWALSGAIIALALLGNYHSRQLKNIK